VGGVPSMAFKRPGGEGRDSVPRFYKGRGGGGLGGGCEAARPCRDVTARHGRCCERTRARDGDRLRHPAGPNVDGLVGLAEEATHGGRGLRREWAGTSIRGAVIAAAVCGRRQEQGLPGGAGATGAVILGGGGQRQGPRPAAGPAATVESGGPRRG